MKETIVKEMLAHPIASVVIIGAVGSAVAGVAREIMKPSVMKVSASKPTYVRNIARDAVANAVMTVVREPRRSTYLSKSDMRKWRISNDNDKDKNTTENTTQEEEKTESTEETTSAQSE